MHYCWSESSHVGLKKCHFNLTLLDTTQLVVQTCQCLPHVSFQASLHLRSPESHKQTIYFREVSTTRSPHCDHVIATLEPCKTTSAVSGQPKRIILDVETPHHSAHFVYCKGEFATVSSSPSPPPLKGMAVDGNSAAITSQPQQRVTLHSSTLQYEPRDGVVALLMNFDIDDIVVSPPSSASLPPSTPSTPSASFLTSAPNNVSASAISYDTKTSLLSSAPPSLGLTRRLMLIPYYDASAKALVLDDSPRFSYIDETSAWNAIVRAYALAPGTQRAHFTVQNFAMTGRVLDSASLSLGESAVMQVFVSGGLAEREINPPPTSTLSMEHKEQFQTPTEKPQQTTEPSTRSQPPIGIQMIAEMSGVTAERVLKPAVTARTAVYAAFKGSSVQIFDISSTELQVVATLSLPMPDRGPSLVVMNQSGVEIALSRTLNSLIWKSEVVSSSTWNVERNNTVTTSVYMEGSTWMNMPTPGFVASSAELPIPSYDDQIAGVTLVKRLGVAELHFDIAAGTTAQFNLT